MTEYYVNPAGEQLMWLKAAPDPSWPDATLREWRATKAERTEYRYCPECGLIGLDDENFQRCEVNGAGAETFPLFVIYNIEGEL